MLAPLLQEDYLDKPRNIPVTILTGFLGSGKTTLLNRILSEEHGKRIAVIENEFGEVGIDQALVINADEEIFEMSNGCICCTVRGDLIRVLGNLMKRRDKFDYVLVETTGLADPGPVAQTFFMDDEIRAEVDTQARFGLYAQHSAEEFDLQLMRANGEAVRPENGARPRPAPPAETGAPRVKDAVPAEVERTWVAQHEHDDEVGSIAIEKEGDVDPNKLNAWLGELLTERGVDIFRMKGFISLAGESRRFVFQGVHMLFDGQPDRPWGDAPRRNQLIFIGRNLHEQSMRQGFEACLI